MGVNGTNMTQEQWDSNVAGLRKTIDLNKNTAATPSTPPPGVDPAYHDRIVQAYNDSVLRRPADQALANAAIEREKAANNGYGMTDPAKATPNLGGAVKTDAPVSTPAVVPQSNNNANLINSMYDQNYASQLQKLQETRQIQQQGLNSQETGVNQNALQNLNNNDSLAARQLKQLQEVQANNGVRGGDSITATIGNQTAQQQGANSINQDKANQLRDIMEKRSLINNNASANDLALMQQLQATRSGQLIDNNNLQDQRAIQLAQLMGKTADGQNTLGGNQLALQQQGQNFNQGLQTQQFNQSVKNDAFNQNMDTQKFDYSKGIDSRNFDYQKAQDSLKSGQWDKQFEQEVKKFAASNELDWAKMSLDTKQVLGQLAISQQNANTSAFSASNSAANQANDNAFQREKFAYEKDVNNIDNKYKQSQIDKNSADATKAGLDKAYYDAVTLSNKDPLFATKSADEQAKIINTHYQNLKPKDAVSDADIAKFLKK